MEIVKNLITFISPFTVCFGFILSGLILLWLTSKQKLGKYLVTTGCILLIIFSFFSSVILFKLERNYLSIDSAEQQLDYTGIKYVVVLGGAQISDPTIPITSQFHPTALVRLIEGIRLYRKIPDAKLILSGGSSRTEPTTNAELMQELALSLGVKNEDIILESKSNNTYEEAMFIQNLIGKEKFILVTSAAHMPRAMKLFKKVGMNPMPAPTNYLLKRGQKGIEYCFFPNARCLQQSETAYYEYLGLFKEKLAGHI